MMVPLPSPLLLLLRHDVFRRTTTIYRPVNRRFDVAVRLTLSLSRALSSLSDHVKITMNEQTGF